MNIVKGLRSFDFGADPFHDGLEGAVKDVGEGARGEAQFHIFDVVGSGIFDGFTGDTTDDFRRAEELTEGEELGEEMLGGAFFAGHHLDEGAQHFDVVFRHFDVVFDGNFDEGRQAERSFQMTVKLDLG